MLRFTAKHCFLLILMLIAGACATPEPVATILEDVDRVVATATAVAEQRQANAERQAATSTPIPVATQAATVTAQPVAPQATAARVTATIEAFQVTATPQPSDDSRSQNESPNVPSNLQPLVNDILADIEERTGFARSSAQLQSIAAVTWRDGSLGCPQPGMMYTQALVDGYRIIFEVNGKTMAYHTNGTRFFTYCPGTIRPGGGAINPEQ